MMTSVPKVVLDANVLFPMFLRDTLLRAAENGLCQIYWTEEILDEAERNLIKRNKMGGPEATRLFEAMRDAFEEAMIDDCADYLDQAHNDRKDRHVVAAALACKAERIITQNIKDFHPLPSGIVAQRPSAFLTELLEASPETMFSLLRQQAADLKKPPYTFTQLLEPLRLTVPGFVEAVEDQLREVPESNAARPK